MRFRPNKIRPDLLAGAAGLVEINSRLRSDRGLQQAFGRQRCAEQSVVQETLSACTAESVKQMELAMKQIYHLHSQGYRHDYHRQYHILDVDLTGLPCGKKAALATKGYFAGARNRRGRQLGRVLATRYQEVVVDQLFEGRQKLVEAFVSLIQAAEDILELDAAKRTCTLLRVDAGGGSLEDVNWALSRGYQILCKEYSGQRARRLAATVTRWVDDPEEAGRQVGWVEQEACEYVRPVVRIAVRKPNGQWGIALGKRNKKRFEAQHMVMLLGSLAHNVLVWVQQWLALSSTTRQHYGFLRLIRDVFHVSGFLLLDAISGHLKWVWSYQGGMGIMSTPAVAHGIAYVGAGNGKLYALDAQSGQEKWSFPGGNFNSAPAIANGVVYTSAYGGQIYALDALSGQKKWSFSTGSPDYVAVTAAHGLVSANTTNGKVYALDARSGRQKWTYQANENILYATPVVVNTTVYVIPSGGKIVALDAFSGHVKWSYDVAEIQSTPAIANGIVYVGSFGGELSAIQGPS